VMYYSIQRMTEALGIVHMHGRRLLWEWWWPVVPKLVFDQMAAPVLEIICHLSFVFYAWTNFGVERKLNIILIYKCTKIYHYGYFQYLKIA
jgi:hypothetical protein